MGRIVTEDHMRSPWIMSTRAGAVEHRSPERVVDPNTHTWIR